MPLIWWGPKSISKGFPLPTSRLTSRGSLRRKILSKPWRMLVGCFSFKCYYDSYWYCLVIIENNLFMLLVNEQMLRTSGRRVHGVENSLLEREGHPSMIFFFLFIDQSLFLCCFWTQLWHFGKFSSCGCFWTQFSCRVIPAFEFSVLIRDLEFLLFHHTLV